MEKQTWYGRAHFGASVLEETVASLNDIFGVNPAFLSMQVTKSSDTWKLTDFHEFLGEYREEHSSAAVHILVRDERHYAKGGIDLWEDHRGARVTVTAHDRGTVERLSAIFKNRAAESTVPEPTSTPEPPTVFIGHGRSAQWRDLKDHLQDTHRYRVVAYETGARAGHTIRDILQEMLDQSSLAILVMTGEDEMPEGGFRARQNVIHETGLFQGNLGFARAVVLLEEGTEDYSNLQGIHQIRYTKANIRETFGDVLGVLRREFGSK